MSLEAGGRLALSQVRLALEVGPVEWSDDRVQSGSMWSERLGRQWQRDEEVVGAAREVGKVLEVLAAGRLLLDVGVWVFPLDYFW